jgi:hypothetical protein
MSAHRRLAWRRRAGPSLAGTALLALGLPGCPLSDKYFVDPNAGVTGGMPATGVGGATGGTGGDVGPAGGMGTTAGTSLGGAGTIATGGDAAVGAGGGNAGGKGDGKAGGKGDGKAGTEAAAGADGGSAGVPSDCEPGPELCDGISNDCDDEIDEDSACPDGCSAKEYEGHVYVLCVSTDEADAIEYDAASERCQALGPELGVSFDLALAAIETEPENVFLKDWIAETATQDGVIWMGANDQFREKTWVWGRGPASADTEFFHEEPAGGGMPTMDRYNDFGAGLPHGTSLLEDCGGFDSSLTWQWNDLVCTDPAMGYVCEQDP